MSTDSGAKAKFYVETHIPIILLDLPPGHDPLPKGLELSIVP